MSVLDSAGSSSSNSSSSGGSLTRRSSLLQTAGGKDVTISEAARRKSMSVLESRRRHLPGTTVALAKHDRKNEEIVNVGPICMSSSQELREISEISMMDASLIFTQPSPDKDPTVDHGNNKQGNSPITSTPIALGSSDNQYYAFSLPFGA